MRRATLAVLLLSGCAQPPSFTPPLESPPLRLDVAPEPPTWSDPVTASSSWQSDQPYVASPARVPGRRRYAAVGEVYDPVLAALKWLARHQNADGSWSVSGYVKRCRAARCSPNPGDEDFDAGVTGLALLAFLGSGYSHFSRDIHNEICFGDVVKKSLQWLMNHQDPEGCFGDRKASKYMYNHAICALAMSEAYGLTGSSLFRDQAQKAVDFIVAAQNPGKAWRYGYKCGDNDSSVTGWCVTALKSAELSQLSFPRSSYEGARAWLDEVTEENYYRVGYTHKSSGKLFRPGVSEHFDHHETLSAIGIAARLSMDNDARDPRVAGAAMLLAKDLPAWKDNAVDFCYWYWGTCALSMFKGPRDQYWTAWSDAAKKALIDHQHDGYACNAGSWEPVDRWSGDGGRVYATALNALTLRLLGGVRVETPIERDPAVAKQAAPLIAALAADDLDERERAERDLMKLGPAVRPFLEDAAAKSDDAEIRVRAQALLDKGEFRARLGRWMDANLEGKK